MIQKFHQVPVVTKFLETNYAVLEVCFLQEGLQLISVRAHFDVESADGQLISERLVKVSLLHLILSLSLVLEAAVAMFWTGVSIAAELAFFKFSTIISKWAFVGASSTESQIVDLARHHAAALCLSL